MNPSRNSASRAATARPSIGGEQRGRLDIDTTGLPDDLELVMIREEVTGFYDQANIDDAIRNRGFTPATPAMLPAYRSIQLPGRPAPADDLVRIGGLVAMVRPKAVAERERAYARGQTEEAVQTAQRMGTAGNAHLDGANFSEDSGNRVQVRSEAGSSARFKE